MIPAHPRSRGEHLKAAESASDELGSSPLARGTPIAATASHHNVRLIPARAGNTHVHLPPAAPRAAHPRSRGEHSLMPLKGGWTTGSSPLTRRTQPQPHQQRLRRRLVPTNVGNTDSPGRTVPAGSAHPRSRGEHQRAPRLRRPFHGSSPLAWGTH